jgi:uncharacterized iron-regulated membrane protein
MGMGYITVNTATRGLIDIQGEFVIFVVLTIILLIITFGWYLWWIRRASVDQELDHLGTLA